MQAADRSIFAIKTFSKVHQPSLLLLPLCIPHRYSVVYAVSSPVLMALPQSIGGLCVPSCVRLEASPYLPANPVKSQAILHIALLSVCLSVRLSHPAVPQPRGGLDVPACVRPGAAPAAQGRQNCTPDGPAGGHSYPSIPMF